jgi:hypothetical protein
MAYLEGKKTLEWIVSIIGSDPAARQMLTNLSGYSGAEPRRIRELSDWLNSQSR